MKGINAFLLILTVLVSSLYVSPDKSISVFSSSISQALQFLCHLGCLYLWISSLVFFPVSLEHFCNRCLCCESITSILLLSSTCPSCSKISHFTNKFPEISQKLMRNIRNFRRILEEKLLKWSWPKIGVLKKRVKM